jgi:Ca2+-transporting ATPase
MWASEETPFDPMEKSIHAHYTRLAPVDLRTLFHMVKEYPLSGHPPTMTHIFENPNGERIIGCKGAPEGVMKLCSVSEELKEKIRAKCAHMAAEGYRVLGVAKGLSEKDELPEKQEECPFLFLGLIAFSDPPVQGIREVIGEFYDAGVDVKMITGDFPATAKAIAAQAGFRNLNTLTGDELMQIPPREWPDRMRETAIFARITPETKLRIVNALKDAGHIVSMTGDGVNDAPALKAAHIGIAMGKRGTEVAKEAAELVLAKDDLSKMIEAIFLGRQINENLTKAIRYIISIHIPIILLVLSPILFPGLPDMLFTPVHVIFLELIMGPTCSILFENEKIPREELSFPADSKSKNLLKLPQLGISLIQGILITAACLLPLIWLREASETLIRTHVFTTLILCNIFLTLVNRSFRHSLLKTIRRKNNLIPVIIGIALLLLSAFQLIPYFSRLFRLEALNWHEWLICLVTAALGTLWIEPIKALAKGKLP